MNSYRNYWKIKNVPIQFSSIFPIHSEWRNSETDSNKRKCMLIEENRKKKFIKLLIAAIRGDEMFKLNIKYNNIKYN